MSIHVDSKDTKQQETLVERTRTNSLVLYTLLFMISIIVHKITLQCIHLPDFDNDPIFGLMTFRDIIRIFVFRTVVFITILYVYANKVQTHIFFPYIVIIVDS